MKYLSQTILSITTLSIILFFGAFAFPEEMSPKIPGNSIYQLESVWKDQTGKNLSLNSFQGKKVIISMVYTKCEHACPMTIAKIKTIEKKINDLGINNYKIILASFDPKRDTPKHLAEYKKKKKLNEKWIFITAPSDSEVRELAAVLGINYKPLGNGEFSHSNIISLLDESGVIAAKIEGLSADISSLISKFKK